MKVFAEYIWLDGGPGTSNLRSKTKVLDVEDSGTPKFPDWGFDGSSTNQAEGHFSDLILKPVCSVVDPLREGEDLHYEAGGVSMDWEGTHYLVLCEVFNADGTPHLTNKRAHLRQVLEAGAKASDPWFGIEQEYTLYAGSRPLGFPEDRRHPPAQGPYYCGVGTNAISGRPLVEAHMKACLRAGLLLSGVNAEVMPGQWEFQIGSGDPLTVADHLWLARWLLHRIGEDYGIGVTFDPKPVTGDWNGAGCHTNFSTAQMRLSAQPDWVDYEMNGTPTTGPFGMEAIEAACVKLQAKHDEHIAVYGEGIEFRLTGRHETCSYREFKWGVGNRGASVRVPLHVAQAGCGYLEDRRPCANIDPYVVTARILETVCS